MPEQTAIDQGDPILLETGVNIQPWVCEQVSLANAAPHRTAHLVAAIRREGLVL
jgi:hypothetical protein